MIGSEIFYLKFKIFFEWFFIFDDESLNYYFILLLEGVYQ